MKSDLHRFVFTAIVLSTAFLRAEILQSSDSVILFKSPSPFTVIHSSACTVEVEPKIPVVSIELFAQCMRGSEGEQEMVSLGRLSNPPYRVLWNLDSVYDQLLTGASLYAEALMPDSTIHTSILSGIFVLGIKKPVPSFKIPFC